MSTHALAGSSGRRPSKETGLSAARSLDSKALRAASGAAGSCSPHSAVQTPGRVIAAKRRIIRKQNNRRP
jgi:hypothetical protein